MVEVGKEERDSSTQPAESLRQPACDACKARKVKCDKRTPCSSCAASKIPCKISRRSVEKKQRIHLSSRHGEEIADVNRKLEYLSDAIKDIARNQKGLVGVSPRSTHDISRLQDFSPSTTDLQIPFEGDTSFTAQSKSIAKTLDSTFQHASTLATPDQQSAALTKIHSLLRDVSSSRTASSSNSFGRVAELSSLPLIPAALVLKILRFAKERPQRFFLEFQLPTIEDFTQLCQKLYFPTEDYTITVWITVNCCLFYLFYHSDKTWYTALDVTKSEIEEYRDQCASNVDNAVQKLHLLMEPTLDGIQALTLASSVFMDTARPSAAWMLISAACRMCLDLGLHRQPTTSDVAEAKKQKIFFWYAYACDKGLGLNFGRTSNIHDDDITVERPKVPEDLDGPFAGYFIAWIDFAQFQGDLMRQLFSARAQEEPQEERTRRAKALAVRMDRLESAFQGLLQGADSAAAAVAAEHMRDDIFSANVIVDSLRTMIYKCIPPPQPVHPLQFCDECITSARAGLRNLMTSWEYIKAQDDHLWRMFVHSTLLFVPFVPFIVVFGNAIAFRDRGDLALLEKMVGILKAAQQASSPIASAIEKLKIACERFLLIAQAYINQPPEGQQRVMRRSSLPRTSGHQQVVPQIHQAAAQMPLGAHAFQQFGEPIALDSLPDFSWDDMFSEWDLGLGAESAREMSTIMGQYMGSM